jgi:hypothetical protein
MRNNTLMWTLVQHSGFTTGGDPMFRKGLEEAGVEQPGLKDKIVIAGGFLFGSYADADTIAHDIMYHYLDTVEDDGALYLRPKAEGRFEPISLGGRKLYVPTPEEAARADALMVRRQAS